MSFGLILFDEFILFYLFFIFMHKKHPQIFNLVFISHNNPNELVDLLQPFPLKQVFLVFILDKFPSCQNL